MIATVLAAALAAAAPVPADAHRVAVKISSWGPRPAASAREERAHRLMARVFRRANLRVGVQEFRVSGHGRSRNVIGVYNTPRTCLRIVMAHTDSAAGAPGANDNGSGLGVVASLAGRLTLLRHTAMSGWWQPELRSASTPARQTISVPWRWHGERARTALATAFSGRSRLTRSAATARSGFVLQ